MTDITESILDNEEYSIAVVPTGLMVATCGLTTHPLSFTLTNGKRIEVEIDEVCRDGRTSWYFVGHTPGAPRTVVIVDGEAARAVTPVVKGWYTTQRPTGPMWGWLRRNPRDTSIKIMLAEGVPDLEGVDGAILDGVFEHLRVELFDEPNEVGNVIETRMIVDDMEEVVESKLEKLKLEGHYVQITISVQRRSERSSTPHPFRVTAFSDGQRKLWWVDNFATLPEPDESCRQPDDGLAGATSD